MAAHLIVPVITAADFLRRSLVNQVDVHQMIQDTVFRIQQPQDVHVGSGQHPLVLLVHRRGHLHNAAGNEWRAIRTLTGSSHKEHIAVDTKPLSQPSLHLM